MYVRHEQEMVDRVLALAAQGVPKLRIARDLGLDVGTVRRWIASNGSRVHRTPACSGDDCPLRLNLDPSTYSYLLGQYLGDGWIDLNGKRGVQRFTVACCVGYPGVIDEVHRSIQAIAPMNKVGQVARPGVLLLQCYSKHWRCLFPQCGSGPKHQRPIVLEAWQRDIALGDFAPLFIRGLIHSDGWRGINPVRGPNGKRYEYPRYIFTNKSVDILGLFTAACDVVGVAWRPMTQFDVAVSQRASVELLDSFVGPKS